MSRINSFDVDENTRKVLIEKAGRRAVLREQFQKLATDPFIHATGHGGAVFDPALLRHNAMRLSTFEHFRPTGNNALIAFGFLVAPMFVYGYFLYNSRLKKETKYRRGEVAYKDRQFKFI